MSAGKTSALPTKISAKGAGSGGKGGFTLLELIVVLVIVGLVTALAAPRMIGSLTRAHLRTSVQKVASALRYARSQAVSQRAIYSAVFDFEKNGCVIDAKKETESDDPNAEVEEQAAETDGSGENKISEAKSYELPETVKIEKGVIGEEEFESESFEILFYPAGNSTGGTVVLIDEKENRFQIDIDPITGMVKMTVPDEDD